MTKRRKIAGTVYLVGAGPGDPGLLTLKAKACLERAEYVFFDQLVNPELLRHCPKAKLFDVGKRGHRGHFPQEQIARLLIRAARRHRVVVRLKGGDPFVFGRGGEEAEYLARHGVPFEVVPGVTAASGAASYAGIPLTHRDHVRAVVFVTGHLKDGSTDLDWAMLARPRQTVVIYMGVTRLAEICGQLVAHGLDPATPAAVIEIGRAHV